MTQVFSVFLEDISVLHTDYNFKVEENANGQVENHMILIEIRRIAVQMYIPICEC